MKISRIRSLLLLAALAAGVGCAGDGTLLPDPGGGTDEATLVWIQANIFDLKCATCHFPGGSAPMPIDNVDTSYANLVDIGSLENPSLNLVHTGDSEISYLVHKIEGRPTILGQRMPPPPMSALSDEEIAWIREWIDSGAPR